MLNKSVDFVQSFINVNFIGVLGDLIMTEFYFKFCCAVV